MKSNEIVASLSVLFASILFGVGLEVSGMTNPEKVIGFLDFFGEWDPSLAFVMGGAICVHFVTYKLVRKKEKPICSAEFGVPTNTVVDRKLIIGAAVFGIGWGMGGFCPGPALATLFRAQDELLIIAFAIITGMLSYNNFAANKNK